MHKDKSLLPSPLRMDLELRSGGGGTQNMSAVMLCVAENGERMAGRGLPMTHSAGRSQVSLKSAPLGQL